MNVHGHHLFKLAANKLVKSRAIALKPVMSNLLQLNKSKADIAADKQASSAGKTRCMSKSLACCFVDAILALSEIFKPPAHHQANSMCTQSDVFA